MATGSEKRSKGSAIKSTTPAKQRRNKKSKQDFSQEALGTPF